MHSFVCDPALPLFEHRQLTHPQCLHRDSFNMVIVMTDGHASDGKCDSSEGTCIASTDKCSSGDEGDCTLVNAAPKLTALADRNQTVTVVSVGFGQVDLTELKLIASDESNVIRAQGQDAASGLAALKKLLNLLVAKVCGNLPHDCVIGYTPWSACDAPCGPQTQRQKVSGVLHKARNGGRPCPSSKWMKKTFRRACPEIPCTTATGTANTAKTTKPANTAKATSKSTGGGTTKKDSNANTPAKTGTGTGTGAVITTNGVTDSGNVANEVDGGNAQRVMWTLAIACSVTTLFV